jgi:hypothetical protein
MEQNVGLLAMNRDVGGGPFNDRLGRGGDILVVLVLLWRLRGVGLDRLCYVRIEL